MTTSTSSVQETIKKRLSTHKFDSSKELSTDVIKKLVECAAEAPSSFNIQHWRFIAVTKKEDRQILQKLSYNQAQVGDASVTFIVLGDKEAHKDVEELLKRSIANGSLPEKAAEAWRGMIGGIYDRNPELARDEAIRSCSLASMNLMLAASEMGLCSCPMIGFDPKGVMAEFKIPEKYVPVMLLPVGYAAENDDSKRKARLAVDEILAFDREEKFTS